MPTPAGADAVSILSQNTASSTGGPGAGGRSVYPKGPSFSLDTFATKDFIVKDFIEALSDGAAPVNRRSGPFLQGAFDPKPYIRTFEHALTRLNILSDERESHEEELANAVRRAEGQHKQHCATLQHKLDQALESFNRLEQKLDSSSEGGLTNGYAPEVGGRVALQIGERLEELDGQKRRAEDAKFLLQCWQDVSERGDLSHLEDIRRLGGSEGKVKCAQVARQLLKIGARLDDKKTPKRVSKYERLNGDSAMAESQRTSMVERTVTEFIEMIEKFLEKLEKDLLEQFDDYKRQHNDQGMRECATALFDFAEGSSVMGRFVNQHELFLERSHLIAEEVSEDQDLWDRFADPDSESPGVESSLQSLVDEVKLVLQEESFVIRHVFPFYEQVLVTFLQRIFQQLVQQRLELVVETANSVSSLAFLRTLQASRNYMGAMVDDLKSHGLTEHPDAVPPQIAAMLDQQLEDLFVPYLAGTSYIDRERKSLEELYSSLLFKFTLWHSRRRKAPTTYLGSIGQRGRELLASARDTYIESLDSSELPSSQKSVLLQIAGISDGDTHNKAEIDVSEDEGVLSLPIAKRMLKWLAEAVGRGLELGGGSETPKDVSILLRLLLTHMGEIYLDTALDAATETASVQESSKTEPNLTFIADLRSTVSILHLMLKVTHDVLLPLAASNITTHREMEKAVVAFVVRMEDKIGTIRTRTIDVALSWVSKLLLKQNRADFRPKDDAIGFENFQTPTCSSIFDFLTNLRSLVDAAVTGENAETFFTELAVGLRSLLFEHFKKFQVNLAGGLMVSKDITKYIELLRTFPLSASFQPSLEVLIEVGNLFVISAEALKDRLRGGSALAGIDKADLRPYILRREDANSIGVQAVLNAL